MGPALWTASVQMHLVKYLKMNSSWIHSGHWLHWLLSHWEEDTEAQTQRQRRHEAGGRGWGCAITDLRLQQAWKDAPGTFRGHGCHFDFGLLAPTAVRANRSAVLSLWRFVTAAFGTSHPPWGCASKPLEPDLPLFPLGSLAEKKCGSQDNLQGGFSSEAPCSMVLKLRELPGVLHTDWGLGSYLEVLGYPVQDVVGTWVCFKGPRGLLLGSLWAEFLRHFWIHSWEHICSGALPEGALHSSTATVNGCCQPTVSGVRSSLLSWTAGPRVKAWQPASCHRHGATWAGPEPSQRQMVLA